MATNETQSDKNEGKKPAGAQGKTPKSEAPEGFDQSVGREAGDGWLKKTAGQVVVGRLLGRYALKGMTNDDGEARIFFQIQLLDGCEHVVGGEKRPGVLANWTNPDDKEDKREVVLEVGQILNVDEHAALEDLGPYTRNGGVFDVWMKYISQDKIPGKGNRTFWRMNGPRLRTVKPATRRPDPDNIQVDSAEGKPNIPF